MAAAGKPLHHNIPVDRKERDVRIKKTSRSGQYGRGVQIVLALH